MKNHTIIPLLASCMFFASCEKETLLNEGEVPQEIQTYILTHFPQNKIIQSIKDNEGFIKTYDILLDSAISLEFNRQKEIISIDGNKKLPDSVIPAKIKSFITNNYPNNTITDWEKENNRVQQIELDNGLDLEFDGEGTFLRVDN